MVIALVRTVMFIGLLWPGGAFIAAQEPADQTESENASAEDQASASSTVTKKKKLDGPTRARILAALGAFVILGFGMVSLTWLGARITRRYMQSEPKPPSEVVAQLRGERWAKPIRIDDPHE